MTSPSTARTPTWWRRLWPGTQPSLASTSVIRSPGPPCPATRRRPSTGPPGRPSPTAPGTPATGNLLSAVYLAGVEHATGQYGPFYVPSAILGRPPAGATHLLLVVDPGNAVPETDEPGGTFGTNNVKSVPLPDRPDLTAAFTSVPPTTMSGQDVPVVVNVQNAGKATASGTIEVGFYLVKNGPLGASVTRVGSVPLPLNVGPGQATPLSTTITLPGSVPAGAYRLVAKVDDGDAIDEGSHEGNNTALSDPLTVRSLSGAAWVNAFPIGSSLNDLDPGFAANVTRFVHAVEAAGATVRIDSTLVPPQRAYLMYWSWRIAMKGYSASKVPPMPGVDIEWWHGDPARSRQAAREMVNGFGLRKLGTAPSLNSDQARGISIEMAITWKGNLTVIDGHGASQTLRGGPRNSANKRLIAIGATYGVVRNLKVQAGKNRWSIDGR